MGKIHIENKLPGQYTLVPNSFITHFIPSANGDFVKVYLFLLHCLSQPDIDLSVTYLADQLNNTENDIIRALAYWEKENLLNINRTSDGEITSIAVLSYDDHTVTTDVQETHVEVATTKEPVTDEYVQPPMHHYTPVEIDKIMQDGELVQLQSIVETMLGTMLSRSHMDLIIYLSTELCFSSDLIIYLYESCIERGKKSHHYIQAVALNWHANGIETISDAEKSVNQFTRKYSVIMDAFGLSRMPAKVEREYMDRWYTFGMDTSVLVEACNRAVLNTGKPSFEYADSIINKWHKQNILILPDVNKADISYKKNQTSKVTPLNKNNQFQSFPQRVYSQGEYSSLEQQLLNK